MKHVMHLNDSAFERILHGSKRVELRLMDSKCRRIGTNDVINFIHADDESRTFTSTVVGLEKAVSFAELLDGVSAEDLGHETSTFNRK